MPKLIIVSDIHNKVARAEAILAHQPHDQVILTGDYFDSWYDTAEDAHRTAVWLKGSLARPERTHLVGNHDHAYRFPYNDAAFCSGYTKEKAYAVNQVLTPDDWARTKYWVHQGGILFGHAGISTRFLNTQRAPKTLPDLIEWLTVETDRAIAATERRENTPLFGAGYSRGGRYQTGGLTWSDHDIDGQPLVIPQIVGHTPHPRADFLFRVPNAAGLFHQHVSEAFSPDLLKTHWWQLDLDTHLNAYALIEDGVLTVREVSWDGDAVRYSYEVFSAPI